MMFRDPPGGAPDAAALARSVAAAYQDVAAEVDVTLELASGQLPEALRGALYRNGPGAMGLGAERYHHPFDGDGMIACFEFDGGAVRYRNRFVATRERAEEQAAGRRLYRCFGTQLPGGWRRNAGRLRFKNSANTSVIKHAGSLWALWEGGWPHRLDPDTLDTLERNNLGGALCNDRSAIDAALNPELPFSAHPRLDARTGHLYNFGIAHGVTPRLMLYTLDAGGHVVERDAVALDAVSFVHDFGLTERWRVFLLPPVSFDLARTLAGVVSPASSLTLRAGEPMKILLVDRHDAAHHIRLDAPPGFVFHLVNAWEDGRGHVFVDALQMEALPPPDFWRGLLEGRPASDVQGSSLVRYEIDPAAGVVRCQTLASGALELPTADADGQPHERAWFIYAPPEHPTPYQSALARWDNVRARMTHRDLFPDLPGEPVYVEDPTGASAGWLLCVVYRVAAHRSDLLVVDADTLDEIACLRLPHHLPPGFHGSWVAASP
jgi:all-trans-8'-apo-beta-carotenal 15,15'-oxygenase